MAGAVAFLVSDAASWITGETMVIDGGLLLGASAGLPDATRRQTMSTLSVQDDLDARVQALLDEHDPATTEPRDFLGAQYDAGLAWVHLPLGFGGLDLPRTAQQRVDRQAGSPRARRWAAP